MNLAIKNPYDKIDKVRRFGLFAKGFLYFLMGSLAFLAAFGFGVDFGGHENTLKFLLQLPAGKIIVFTLASGLMAYSLWRIYKAYLDPKGKGRGGRWFNKMGFVYSGVVYGFFAITFYSALYSANFNADAEEAMLSQVLNMSAGPWIMAIIIAAVVGQGIFQLWFGFSENFMFLLDNDPANNAQVQVLKTLAKIGYTSRGVVFLILAYFLLRVLIAHDADVYDGTKGVFYYLLNLDAGNFLMGTLGMGLLIYGVFTFIVGFYSNLSKIV